MISLQSPSFLSVKEDGPRKSARSDWRSSKRFIILTVSVAIWTDFFLYNLVVPILPFILKDRVNVPDTQIQRYVSGMLAAYAGSSMIFSPVTGYVADQIRTRKMPFLLGLLALLGSTILMFLGKSIPIFFLARILQGLSGAFVWTIGMVMCVETVGTDALGQTMGAIFGSAAFGNLFTPPAGGLLYEKTGLYGVFGVAVAIILIDLGMRLLMIENNTGDHDKNCPDNDVESSSDTASCPSHDTTEVLHATEITGLLAPSHKIQNAEATWKISTNLPEICYRITILPCLFDPRLLSAMFLTFVQAMLLGAFDATIPTIAREYYDLSPLMVSLLFLPLGICNLLLGPIFGNCVDRYGTKCVAVLGHLYLAVVLCLLQLPQPGGVEHALLYGCILAICGIGLASIYSTPFVEAARILDRYYEANKDFYSHKKPYAQLYGMNNVVYNAGLTLGPELAGELKQSIGYGNMNLVFAGVCAVAAVLSWFYVGDAATINHVEVKAETHPE